MPPAIGIGVAVLAVVYGAQLMLGAFVRHPVTEALRIDTIFLVAPTTTETRMREIDLDLFEFDYDLSEAQAPATGRQLAFG